MSIKIIKPGIMATLQGMGRSGYRNIGIGSGGSMDTVAAKLANYLCGNDDGATVIEMNFPAPEILFKRDAVIAITGADFNAAVNEIDAPLRKAFIIKKSSVLKFKKPVTGSKGYLAVQGGWHAEKWLGSYSTHLKLSIGGHYGRALQKDDCINFTPVVNPHVQKNSMVSQTFQQQLENIYQPFNIIRIIAAPEYYLLSDLSKQTLEKQSFTINHQSDRMGFRLNKQPVLSQQRFELISSPADAGTIQLLPDGSCIILMADHQTTGGYPRIVSVIKADMSKLAQAKAGQSLTFKMISLQHAEEEYIRLQETLAEIKTACNSHLNKF